MNRILLLTIALAATVACTPTEPLSILPEPPPMDGGPMDDAMTPDEDGGTPPPNGNGYISGSRLRAKYLLAADGAKEFNGWHDSQLGVDCLFMIATDGQKRCLPWYINAEYYSDASCTQLVTLTNKLCGETAPTEYALINISDDICIAKFGAYQPTGAMLPSQPSLYENSGGMCKAAYASWETYYHAYILGPEIPPSSFVAATDGVE
jgi:hypothetical protein